MPSASAEEQERETVEEVSTVRLLNGNHLLEHLPLQHLMPH